MRSLVILCLLFSFSSLASEKFITRIHSISWAQRGSEAHLMKFENARVAFIYHVNKSISLANPGELVEVEVGEDQKLISLLKVPDTEEVISVNSPFVTDVVYQPTILTGYAEALSIFKELRSNSLPGSQCYDRAHVWAYDQYQKRGLQSMKGFVFFSDDYIRKYTFKWWFHVAPYVTYYSEGLKKERILDRTLADHPISLRQWTDKFMEHKRSCKEITKYSEFTNPKGHEDCYLMKVSMFYWQPKDLEAWEESGVEKVNFFEWEIAHSYENAFGIRMQ